MKNDSRNEITELLNEWSNGDEVALESLMPLVYEELRKMATQYMRNREVGQTLQPTVLIHEVYLKLVKQEKQCWENRTHFFGVASKAMRHILVDYLRNRRYLKRGGGAKKIEFDESIIVTNERAVELVALDDALTRLSELDDRKGRVVELKYFGGLDNEEIAEVLKISSKTVIRDWQFARSWLLRELSN
ncbi:MAG: sigma-70 family RNA polymerase sigma factor [Acidobacteria bacterium]|nr:sigma-70 family RNA polymerase sigma factor [Acidobacteriota bacterium]